MNVEQVVGKIANKQRFVGKHEDHKRLSGSVPDNRIKKFVFLLTGHLFVKLKKSGFLFKGL